jgi:hypothetical protein
MCFDLQPHYACADSSRDDDFVRRFSAALNRDDVSRYRDGEASTIYDNVLGASGEIERKDREKKLAKLRERMMWHGVLDDKAVVVLHADELEELIDLAADKRPTKKLSPTRRMSTGSPPSALGRVARGTTRSFVLRRLAPARTKASSYARSSSNALRRSRITGPMSRALAQGHRACRMARRRCKALRRT